MEYDKLEMYVSPPWLNRFLIASDGCKIKAKELYKTNIEIAQGFYPILHLFEIILRNRIDLQLSQYFNCSDWIISEINGFMSDSSLKESKFFMKSQVERSSWKIKQRGGPITSGKLVAEQTLGFWVSLFETHHYKLVSGAIIQCFPDRPSNIKRKQIYFYLKNIRDFRNRVYHNEPICFHGNEVSFNNVEKIKTEIYKLLSWIDPEIVIYVTDFDTIAEKIPKTT